MSRGAEGRAVLVGEPERPDLRRLAGALSRRGFEVEFLGGSRGAPLTSAYRRASLAVVADGQAMRGARLAQRLARVPWLALFDATPSRLPPPGIVRRARAVILPGQRLEQVRNAYPTARLVALEDEDQVAAVALDVAIPPDARGEGSGVAKALATTWMFADDRAGRLAIRLMPKMGRARHPIHPKHIAGNAARHWYLKELGPDDSLLDIGCGHGGHTLPAARVVRQAVGVDIDDAALDDARRRAASEGIENARFERSDLADPTALARFRNGEFDAVLLLDVLEHLFHRQHVLREVARLLAPGGRLFVAVPNRDTPYKRWRRRIGAFAYGDPDHKVEYDADGARLELEQAGYTVVRFEAAGIDSPFAGFSALLAAVSMKGYVRLAQRRQRLGRERPDDAVAFHLVANPRPAPPAQADQADAVAPSEPADGPCPSNRRRGARVAIWAFGAVAAIGVGIVATQSPVLPFVVGVVLAAATIALSAPARVWSVEFFLRWGFVAASCFIAALAGFALGQGHRSAVLALCAAAAWSIAAARVGLRPGGLVVISGALPAFGLGALAALAPQFGLLTLLLVSLLVVILTFAPRSLVRACLNRGVLLCALFVVVVFVSSLVALDRETSLAIAKTELGRAFLLPLAIVAVFDTLTKREAYELGQRLGLAVVAVAVAGAVLSVLQIGLEIGYPVRFASGTSMEQFVGSRALGFAEHPNSWAAFLLVAIAFSGTRWLAGGGIAWGLGTLLLTVSLVVTGSRSGWLALGTAGVVAFVATRSTKLRLATVAVAVVSVLVALQFANFRSFVAPGATGNDRGRIAVDESAQFRLRLMRGELEIATHDPATGVGPGNIALGLDALGDDYLRRNGLVFPSGRVDKHNVYTGLLAESGVPALALFLAVLAAGFVSLYQARRAAANPKERTLVSGLVGALLASVVIAAFTDADRHLYLWWTLGMAFALRSRLTGTGRAASPGG